MLRGATFIMRIAVSFIGVVVLLFSIMLFPELNREAVAVAEIASLEISKAFAFVNYIFIACLYATVIPFLFALYQTFKLLSYIDNKKAFSVLSVKVLSKIKYCAVLICGLYMVGVMPMAYCFADLDDAPGVILIALVVGFAPLVIATFSAILQTLLTEAIEIKSENDLTI